MAAGPEGRLFAKQTLRVLLCLPAKLFDAALERLQLQDDVQEDVRSASFWMRYIEAAFVEGVSDDYAELTRAAVALLACKCDQQLVAQVVGST